VRAVAHLARRAADADRLGAAPDVYAREVGPEAQALEGPVAAAQRRLAGLPLLQLDLEGHRPRFLLEGARRDADALEDVRGHQPLLRAAQVGQVVLLVRLDVHAAFDEAGPRPDRPLDVPLPDADA